MQQIKTPMLPESVADATVLVWHKQVGDLVARDEILLELETDKVVLEVPSPIAGRLEQIYHDVGSVVTGDQVLAIVNEVSAKEPVTQAKINTEDNKEAAATADQTTRVAEPAAPLLVSKSTNNKIYSPSNRRLHAEQKSSAIHSEKQSIEAIVQQIEPSMQTDNRSSNHRLAKRVTMTRLRKKIAERLLIAKNTTAMLTTFNEIDMQEVMNARATHQEAFIKKYGIKLGLMSFFTKAVCEALKEFPAVNASIDADEIVYHGFYDIGIAVSTERGLVVPVIKDVDNMSLANIEHIIAEYANKARSNKLDLSDLQGGTFTITNGGVFGSLLSTPIINPPQTAILGMHKIEERPVVVDGQIVIRPMMYVALSYDHRLIDGKESVQFLTCVKRHLEDPVSFVLGL